MLRPKHDRNRIWKFSAAAGLFCAIATVSAAHATTPVFVDPGGVCNGESDCFTTIQAAVRSAHDPDGAGNPQVAEVFVFPGVYAESVDLNQMGADVNAVEGDICIVSVDAAGTPTAGTVTINPAAGAAIFIPDAEEFIGGIKIDGFLVTSPDDSAISLDEVDGPVTIANVVANGAADDGIFVFDVSPRTIPGALVVMNCTANNNTGGRGIDLVFEENITVTGCTANGNNNAAFGVGIDVQGAGNGLVTGCNANENGANGIEMTVAGTSTVMDSTANDNELAGIFVQYFVFAPLAEDILIDNCTALRNGTLGIGAQHAIIGPGNITVLNSTANNNGQNGYFIDAEQAATVTNCAANENTQNGFRLGLSGGDTTITGCTANDNIEDGGIVTFGAETNVVITDCTAHRNGDSGIQSLISLENTTFTQCQANDNGDAGISAFAEGVAQILECEAHRNIRRGITVNSNLGTVVQDCVTNENKVQESKGVLFFGEGVSANTDASLAIVRSVANDNEGSGLNANAGFGVEIAECTALRNGIPGVFFGGYGIGVFQGCEVRIAYVTSSDNLTDGIAIGFEVPTAVVENESGKGQDCFAVQLLEIMASVIRGNGEDGIDLQALQDEELRGLGGNFGIFGSIVCENVRSGLRLRSDVGVNAEGNWWGSETGPTHPNNPAGLGDEILDGNNDLTGLVVFDPWIDTVAAALAGPVMVGVPVGVSFQFLGGGGTHFLGEGPGDPNGDPTFTITTDNGVLTSSTDTAASVMEFINAADGVLNVTWTPGMAGPATIILEDFCNLRAEIPVDVEGADLSVTKVDSADPVTVGDALIYTVTVANNGTLDAPNVLLVDQLPGSVAFISAVPSQGACNHVAGVVTCNLGDIANGAQATVEIAVTTTQAGLIKNVAEATSDEDDPDLANNVAEEETLVIDPTPQSQPTSAPSSQPAADCGAGLCGFGTLGVMPFMLLGLGLMRRNRG